MRILQAKLALLFWCGACMGCSSPQVMDEENERSALDAMPVAEGWTPIQLGLIRDIQLFPSMYNVHGLRIGGWSWIVNGLDVGIANFSYAAHGIQVAGLGNLVGTEGWGLQVAGYFNPVGQGYVDDGYSGLQVAGFTNSGSADGIQLAGWSNGFYWIEKSRVEHTHWYHGLNIYGHIRGLQVAGVLNVCKHIAGVQASSVFNLSFEGFSGLQVGAINVAEGKADIGDRGRVTCSGMQVGAFNATGIFDSSTQAAGFCVQVGVINMVDGGSGVQVGLWNSNPDGFLPHCPILNFSFGPTRR
jgi:hypothetical protein